MARAMAERWPEADVTGSDLSAEMLAAAASSPSRVTWETIDVREWNPDRGHDVIYANAVLHWVDDHESLLPRLVSYLNPGGVLAIQMPLSWHEPSHRLMRAILTEGGSGGTPLADPALCARYERQPVESAAWYSTTLRPHVTELDIWETRYLQVLTGPDPVYEWVSGTALRPILEGLDAVALEQFIEIYRAALRTAYPSQPDGTTLYPFPRLFIVATR
jgi:trans-aconitate 2-methyltransferase